MENQVKTTANKHTHNCDIACSVNFAVIEALLGSYNFGNSPKTDSAIEELLQVCTENLIELHQS